MTTSSNPILNWMRDEINSLNSKSGEDDLNYITHQLKLKLDAQNWSKFIDALKHLITHENTSEAIFALRLAINMEAVEVLPYAEDLYKKLKNNNTFPNNIHASIIEKLIVQIKHIRE